jgi:GGDEF domain-containing protein
MNKSLTKQKLLDLVKTLSWNDRFGCYTRPGLEQYIWSQIQASVRYVIFLDVDDMHQLNETHGYEGVNEIIKQSLGSLRATDYIAGQWFSGDEFAVFVTDSPQREHSNPNDLCERLRTAFHQHGASATFGIAPVTSQDLSHVVRPAFELVQNAKKAGRRGTINSSI